MSEEIVAYVAASSKGRNWTSLEQEFTKVRKWSKGKFINHFKEAKKTLEKKLDEKGKPRYFSRQDDKTRKIVLKQYLAQQSINHVSIPNQFLENAWRDFQKRLREKYGEEKGIHFRKRLGRKEREFFKEASLKENVNRYSNAFGVDLVYPKGTMSPEIPDWAFWQLLQITFASAGFPRRTKGFKIILNFDPTRVKKKHLFDKNMFKDWLQKFKGEIIDPDLLEHLAEERTQKTDIKPEVREKLLKYMKFQSEFLKKDNLFLQAITKQFLKSLEKWPELYKKVIQE